MSKNLCVLITRSLPAEALSLLRAARPPLSIDHWDSDDAMSAAELKARLENKHGVLMLLGDALKGDTLNHLSASLKCVSTMSVGYDHIDVGELKKRGVRVGYTPDILTDTSAELTIALLLATSRRLLESHKALLQGKVGAWKGTWMCGKDLKGSTVGLVGFGRIGQAIAKKLSAFEVEKFLFTTRSKHESCPSSCYQVPLDELLSQSDFVVLVCSSNESTRGLVNQSFLEKMKKDAILINSSRGDVVNQTDLANALRSGTIFAAGLDVTTPEPLPPDHELLHLPNCVVLPHIGSATLRTRVAMACLAAENLLKGLNDEPMPAEL